MELGHRNKRHGLHPIGGNVQVMAFPNKIHSKRAGCILYKRPSPGLQFTACEIKHDAVIEQGLIRVINAKFDPLSDE